VIQRELTLDLHELQYFLTKREKCNISSYIYEVLFSHYSGIS